MEKKLEKMRTETKHALVHARAITACLLILMCVVVSGVIPKHLPNANASEFMDGFQVGLLIGLLCVALSYLVKYQRALKDDAKLKQLYYQENDERQKYICQMAGQKSMQISLFILLTAAIIAGYFSNVAFFSLLGATVVQALVVVGIKFYYSKTTTGMEE